MTAPSNSGALLSRAPVHSPNLETSWKSGLRLRRRLLDKKRFFRNGDRSGHRGEEGAHVTIATSARNRSPRRRRFPLISVPSLGSAGLSSSMRLLVVCRLSVHCQRRGKNDQGRAMAAALCRLGYHDLRSTRGANVNKRAMSPPPQKPGTEWVWPGSPEWATSDGHDLT